MTKVDRDRLYLTDLIEYGRRIVEYSADGRDAFLASRKSQDAIIRCFSVMGEAAKRLSDGIRDT